jgi:hypothetical protein
MQSLTATDILDLWERGAGLHAIDQAVLVLSQAFPERTYDYLTTLPLGQRDELLFQVHRLTFGDRLDAYTECPVCQEPLEFPLSCELLCGDSMPHDTLIKTVTIQGRDFNLRCPNSRDAAAAAASENVETAKRTLLSLCALRASGSMQDIDSVPEATESAIAAELATMDPHAETLLDLFCPACGHAWQAIFEITTFLWTQIRVQARRLLQEVNALARAYGWNEAEILGMSDMRRKLYVQMAIA